MKVFITTLFLLVLTIQTFSVSGANTSGQPKESHCCVSELGNWYNDPEPTIRKRFEIFKSMGVDMIRVDFSWRNMEWEEGKWNPDITIRYLKLAKEYRFRIKLIIGVMMAPPRWYLDKHPEAMLTDQNGKHSYNTMSYWYPGLQKIIDTKTGELCDILKKADVWDSVDYVIPSFGPAGEPVYPALWTLGPGFTSQTFWCYDASAQDDFRREIKRKYRSISKANKVWGTDFKTWDDVRVLPPGSRPGPYWNDVLIWYRDSKREFIRWQIANTRKHFGSSRKILLYVPGTDFSDKDIAEAVHTGGGNDLVKLMTDSDFMVDAAAKTGCWLQYTGSDNAPEVERLRRYLDNHKYNRVEMWGENAGEWGSAHDPVFLAETVVKNRLFGLDYTHTRFVFEEDRQTPNNLMPELVRAFAMVKAYWNGRDNGK